MNKIKQAANNAKNFVVRHKTKILVGALVVTTAGTALGFRNKKVADEFLKENGLFEKFYELNED